MHTLDSTADTDAMLANFRRTLTAFAASRETFRIINYLPSSSSSTIDTPSSSTVSTTPPRIKRQPRTLHILDSSFNPPTLAHRHLALQSLRLKSTPSGGLDTQSGPTTLLLLLATQNADKPAAPAGFPERLAMMTIFGEELRESLNSGRGRGKEGGGGEDGDGLDVVIAVTKHARFVDKADAISSFYRGVEESGDASNDAGSSTASGSKQPEQIWLTGYDTLLRILAPRYYAPGNLSALDPFFESCRVRVMGRAGYGEEDDITEKLRKGELESVGGRKEWCDRIDLLEGLEEEVSSTAVRKAIKDGEWGIVERLVGGKMRQWVEDKGLYR